MYLATLRRNLLIGPLAVAVAALLASSPALAQPEGGTGDGHATPVDDPALATPAPPVAATPAPPVAVLWFYVQDKAKAGPVTTAALRRLVMDGTVDPGTKVWKKGMSGWLPMNTLPEFSDLAPPPTPVAAAALAQATAGPQPERLRNRSFIISGGVVFGVLWLAGIISAVFASEDEQYDYTTGVSETPEEYKKYAQIAWLPVVGPVAGYAGAGGSDNRVIFLTALWSAAQATGLGLFIAGMVGKKNPLYKGGEAGLHVAPLVGDVNGIGLSGRF